MTQKAKWPIIGIYVTHEDKPKFLNYATFYDEHDALIFLRDVAKINGKPDSHKNDLIFESGWRLSTRENSQINNLPALLNKSQNVEGKLPLPSYYHWGIYGNQIITPTTAPSKAPKPARPEKPSNLVTLKELHPDPSEARQILRAANHPKPAHGQWSWPKDSPELATVKKLLKIAA